MTKTYAEERVDVQHAARRRRLRLEKRKSCHNNATGLEAWKDSNRFQFPTRQRELD